MRSPLPFPCVPDRPYKILLVQVGTLSFSHPSFGVPVLFIYLLIPRLGLSVFFLFFLSVNACLPSYMHMHLTK